MLDLKIKQNETIKKQTYSYRDFGKDTYTYKSKPQAKLLKDLKLSIIKNQVEMFRIGLKLF